MRSIIHVNRQHIAMNAKDNGNRHVFTVKRGGKTIYGRSVTIQGPSKMVYSDRPLPCGARAWIETDSEVVIEDAKTFREVREAAA